MKPNLTVEECRNTLINRYKKTLRLQLQPGMHSKYTTFEDLHTRVTLHHTRMGPRGKQTWKEELKGSINSIFTTKVEGEFPTRILLLGAAGYGKTTAVAKLAYDWSIGAEDSPLRDVPLVFLVKFRETDKNWSLGDAIVSGLLAHLKGITAEEIEKFLIENEKDCCILLDGYDEFSGSMKCLDSVTSLIELILFKRFPNCRVLITCRPYLADHFETEELSKIYAKMEIEGFADDDAMKYISNYFSSDPEEGEKLNGYLSERPNIQSLSKIPFLCMALCTLWEGHYLKDTETRTMVFECILMYLQEHAKSRPSSSQQQRANLSEEIVKKSIIAIGRVALNSLLADSNKLLLSRHEFEQCPEDLEIAKNMGLVNTFTRESNKLFKTETMVEFYHKLAQEHCAGVYLANSEVSDIKAILCQLQSEEQVASFENIFRFAVGSSEDVVCLSILKHMETVQWDTPDSNRDNIIISNRDNIIISILGESICATTTFASQVTSLFSLGSLSVKISFTILSGLDKFPDTLKSKVRNLHIGLKCSPDRVIYCRSTVV